MIKKSFLLFIIVFSIGAVISYLVVDKLYEVSLIEKDSTIKSQEVDISSKDDKISDLKDSNKLLEDEIGKLEKQIITLKDGKELKTKKPVLTPLEIEKNIYNWLIEVGYSLRKIKDEKKHFTFRIINPGNRPIFISLPKSEETILMIAIKIDFDKQTQEKIANLNQKEINEFSKKISTPLINLGVEHLIESSLKYILLKNTLFVESLTRTNFMNSIKTLDGGILIVVRILESYFKNI